MSTTRQLLIDRLVEKSQENETGMEKEARIRAGLATLKNALKSSKSYQYFKGALGDEKVQEGLKKALVFGTAGAGLTAGIRGADAAIDSIRTPLHKRRSFSKMMDDNPKLKKENDKDVKRIFNTLHKFNPHMASDPLVAGSFMRRALQFKDEGIQPVDVKTLAEVGKLTREGKKKETLLQSMFGSTF
jgi:hypothetical protein